MSDYDNGWLCDECGCSIPDSLGYCFNCDGVDGPGEWERELTDDELREAGIDPEWDLD